MGKKRTRSEQTNKPVYGTQIEGAANNIADAYAGSKGSVQDVSNNLGQVSQSLFDRYNAGGDPATQAASTYITNTLQGDPQQNPFLQRMIDDTSDSVRRRIQTQLGTRGGIGGSAERDIVSGNLADSELSLRYQDFTNAENRRMQAAGMAPGIAQAGYLPLQMATQAGTAGAMLPSQLAALQGAGIGGLLGQYQNVRGTQTQSGMGLGEMLGLGLQAGSLFSDRRLKTDIRRVGTTDGGVPVYTYKYVWGGPTQMGVMADEVPDALGPVVEGFATVRYEAVA
jgi:hypothetical protein